MLKLLFTLVIALYIVSCDDAKDLTLPEGQLPDAPIAVIFHPEDTDYLELRWTRVPRAMGYHLYSSVESDGEFEKIASVRDTVWRHDFAEAFVDSLYSRFYKVTSVVDSVESVGSGKIGSYFCPYYRLPASSITASLPFSINLTAWRRDMAGIPIPRTESLLPQDVFWKELHPRNSSNEEYIREDYDSSRVVYRDESGSWLGVLVEDGLRYTATYNWFHDYTDPRPLYLCGRVVNGKVEPNWIEGALEGGVSVSTKYCWRESRQLPISELGLLEAGFQGGTFSTSDQVVAMLGGRVARFTGEWFGTLTHLQPGMAYVIQRKHPGGYYYTYTAPE